MQCVCPIAWLWTGKGRARVALMLLCAVAAMHTPARAAAAQTKPAAEAAKKDDAASSSNEEKEEQRKPADPDTGKSTLSDETLGLLPNPFERQGVKLALTYIGESLGNVSGGPRRAAIYEGRLNGAIDVDFGKLAGWSGLAFHANVFQIHGRGLSRRGARCARRIAG